ncbi:MAG: signal peptidase I [Persicimonas sp.]
MTDATNAYKGETKRRNKWLAAALTFLCPGLGYMYVGRLIKGLTLNLVFLLALESFLIALSILEFFPLLPFAVLMVGWLVFSALIAADVYRRAEEIGDDYVLEGYNHWTIYAGAVLLSFVVPIALTFNFATNHMWSLERVEDAAMYPSIQPGDTLLVNRTPFGMGPPERGRLAAVDPPEGDGLRPLRLVAMPGDEVRLQGNSLYVNDEPVDHSPLDDDQVVRADLDEESDLLAWVEHNDGQSYVISVSPREHSELEVSPIDLGEDEFFVLADNRSEAPAVGAEARVRDSRHFGQISSDRIVGVPRYVFWSTNPDGSIRWERIGLRLR